MLTDPLSNLEPPKDKMEAVVYDSMRRLTGSVLMPALNQTLQQNKDDQQHKMDELSERLEEKLDNHTKMNDTVMKSLDAHYRVATNAVQNAETALYEAARESRAQAAENRQSNKEVQTLMSELQKTIGLVSGNDRRQDEQIAALKTEAARLNSQIDALVQRLAAAENSLTLTQNHQVLLRDEIRGTFGGLKEELFQRLDTMQQNIDDMKPKGHWLLRFVRNNGLFILYSCALIIAVKVV